MGMYAVDGSSSLARTNGLAVVWRLKALLDAIFRVSRILLDWIHGLLMAAAGNVVVF
jgi:hypothetical protein